MKIYTKNYSTIIFLSLIGFVITSNICSAQEYSRSGKKEIFGMIQTMDSTDLKFDEPEVDMYNFGWELDSTTIYGFGFGLNMTDHWNLNTDFLFGDADAEFIIPGEVVPPHSSEADLFLWDINLDYNIFADRLTPLETAVTMNMTTRT